MLRVIGEGFTWLWHRAFLRTCALLFAASNLGWEALFLVLVIAAQAQGLSPGTIGLMVGVLGATSLLGSVLATRVQRLLSMRAIVVVEMWFNAGALAFVVEPNVWVLAGGVIPAFLLNPALNATIIGYRVAVTPDRLQGRVTSVARLISFAGAPLGPLVAGALLQAYSARLAVALLALSFVALALWASFSRPMREAPSLDELSSPA